MLGRIFCQRFLPAGSKVQNSAFAQNALNTTPCREFRTGIQKYQESVEKVNSSASPDSDYSLFPPLPGQDSSLRWNGQKYEELPIVHIKATYNK
ncbi:28S ribosomal protein S11, mitochondrial-like [Protopterus annectens]|uniref:28S ribosomal protein S11, mitochondrial-like n=1 Tax=Protopterus annectens TaxID=7888 RepID=UPI001CF9E352|nr:28S ribosomal protein S11, mitochondrial-like [Protopterus annectens]